jgi:hypothetical protein
VASPDTPPTARFFEQQKAGLEAARDAKANEKSAEKPTFPERIVKVCISIPAGRSMIFAGV